MKKPTFYIIFIFLFSITLYSVKAYLNNDNKKNKSYIVDLKNSREIKAEIEILNGCGDAGVATLYSNFLMHEGFDVIESKNADNFDYINTTIIVHQKDKMDVAQQLAKMLKIKNIEINENGIWDLSVIIGKNYKELESFEIIKKHFPPF